MSDDSDRSPSNAADTAIHRGVTLAGRSGVTFGALVAFAVQAGVHEADAEAGIVALIGRGRLAIASFVRHRVNPSARGRAGTAPTIYEPVIVVAPAPKPASARAQSRSGTGSGTGQSASGSS